MTEMIATPPPVPGTQRGAYSYFKLKNSIDYRFWNQGRLVILTKGQVHPVYSEVEAHFYRGRRDVVGECTFDGNFLGALGAGELDPNKAKSFKRYGNAPPAAALPTGLPVGKPMPPPTTSAPVVPGGNTTQKVSPPEPPTPLGIGSGKGPPPLPTPPDRTRGRKSRGEIAAEVNGARSTEPMSPIEEVGSDGKTERQIPTRR